MTKKPKLKPTKVDAYHLLEEAVMNGVRLGMRRAYKHTESPVEDHVLECLERAVMELACEAFDFG